MKSNAGRDMANLNCKKNMRGENKEIIRRLEEGEEEAVQDEAGEEVVQPKTEQFGQYHPAICKSLGKVRRPYLCPVGK